MVPSSVLGLVVPGESSKTVPVTFAPELGATGTSTDAIQFESGSGGTVSLGVRGSAVPVGTLSCVSTDVSGGNFGNVIRQHQTDLHAVCTVSGGYAQLESLALTPETDSSEFALSAPTTKTSLLPPGDDSIVFSVRFFAAGVAAPHSGTVQLTLSSGEVINFALKGTVVAPPPDQLDIDVVMTEVQVPPDLDLHFTQSGAVGPFDRLNAVWWAQRAPDWGPAPENDPFLDRDSPNGAQPEELTLEQVPNGTGDYEVYVHYSGVPLEYAGLVATASVTIRLNRGLSPPVTFIQNLECRDVWHVAHLHFSQGMGVASPVGLVSQDLSDPNMCP
jgi:hypothetical protein